MVSIYIISCLSSNKFYVGISKNPDQRWKRHISSAFSLNKKHNLPLQRAIFKYGKENFVFKVIEVVPTFKEACQKEIDIIKFMKDLGCVLYNLTEGGEGSALSPEKKKEIFNEERRLKMSIRNTGSLNPMFGIRLIGKNNGHFGKKMKQHVANTLLQIRRKLSDEQIEEIRNLFETEKCTQTSLAKKYNVSVTTIHRLLTGKSFTSNRSKVLKPNLKENDVLDIRNSLFNKTKTVEQLAKEYNLSTGHIIQIAKGHKWKNIGGPRI